MIYYVAMDSTIVSGERDIFYRCVEDCHEPIMITDKSGVLIYVNPAWIRTYGYSTQEVIGQTPRLLRSRYQTDEFYREMWKTIQNPDIGFWRGELVNQSKDGRLVTVLLTITPYREGAEIKGYMGIAVDLTAQKEMELKILQQDRLASVGMVASGLAHEVGTPLGVIRGRAEFMQMEAGVSDSLKKGLSVIIEQIDRISKLIKSFLKASRSPQDLTMAPIDIESLVQDVLILLNQSVRQLGIKVNVSVPQGLFVLADINHLHQVFLNLLINAVHAIERAQETNRDGPYHIDISARDIGSMVEVDLADNGCGISKENIVKLFRPFFTTKDVGKGTGLGLAISAQIMAEMKGQIRMKSEGEGKGATFTITLQKSQSI